MSATALLAESPALPLHTAGKYVAGAYVVLFAIVLIYVAIMATRLSRMESELGDLLHTLDERDRAAAEHARAQAEPPASAPREPAPAYPLEGRR